jgi:hypothetical protein
MERFGLTAEAASISAPIASALAAQTVLAIHERSEFEDRGDETVPGHLITSSANCPSR